jgi:hypothetical protein
MGGGGDISSPRFDQDTLSRVILCCTEVAETLGRRRQVCKIGDPKLAKSTISGSQIEPLVKCAKSSIYRPILQFLPIARRLGTVRMKSAEQAQPEQFT